MIYLQYFDVIYMGRFRMVQVKTRITISVTSRTVALSDSPGGTLYLEQRLRAKVYYQARSQRSVGSNALNKVRAPRSETTCKLWRIYVDILRTDNSNCLMLPGL